MKRMSLLLLAIVFGVITVQGESRFATLKISGSLKETPPIIVSEFETVRVVSAYDSKGYFSLRIRTDETEVLLPRFALENKPDLNSYGPPTPGIVFKGPASLSLISGTANRSTNFCFVTLEIIPESYPPDKTLIVEPNQGPVAITLQSSTNLVNWMSATNGTYSTTGVGRFFRIRLEKIE